MKNPDEQRSYPIVALGSVWVIPGGRRGVPYLFGFNGKRGLDLFKVNSEYLWGEFFRFLASGK